MQILFQKHWSQLQIKEGKSIYLAISGGVDSVVLFHLLRLSEIPFVALHCNFNLRGKDSNADEQFVRMLGSKYDIECLVKSFDTNAELEKQGKGVQEVARNLRYDWFNSVLNENNGVLLTAHHLNDSIETALFNFIRGTDIKGLGGIRSIKDYVYRPLLHFTKANLYEFAHKNKFEFREDVSNAKNDYSRNRIRNNVIPELKEVFPNLESRIKQTINSSQKNHEFIEQQLKRIRKECFVLGEFGIEIEKEKLLDQNLSGFMLVELFKEFGFTDELFFEQLKTFQSGKQLQSKTHRFIVDRENFLICPPLKFTQIHKFNCEEVLKGNKTQLSITEENCTLHPDFKLSLDLTKIQFPLTLRTWNHGDVFYPEGMKGKKKVKDFYRDSKFSIPQKEEQWILTDNNHILWIVGKRKDKRALSKKYDKNTLNLGWT